MFMLGADLWQSVIVYVIEACTVWNATCCLCCTAAVPAVSLLQPVIMASNREYIALFTLHYVWPGHGMLFMLQQYGMYKQHISFYISYWSFPSYCIYICDDRIAPNFRGLNLFVNIS